MLAVAVSGRSAGAVVGFSRGPHCPRLEARTITVGGLRETPVNATGPQRTGDNRAVELFFDLAYALVVFVAWAALGAIPGCLLSLALPGRERRLVHVGIVLAFVGWVWAGWIESTYGISRLGLVLFASIGAAGFVRGWVFGLRLGAGFRGRRKEAR